MRLALAATLMAPKALFGDGEPYGKLVVVADVGAVILSAGITGSAYAAAPRDWGWSMFGMIPPVIAGPSVHLARGRWAPALISFLGWSSVVGTSAGFGALGVLHGVERSPCNRINGAPPCDPEPDYAARGFAIGITIASIGAIGMTALDVFMARPSGAQPTHSAWTPYFIATPNGASAGVSATF